MVHGITAGVNTLSEIAHKGGQGCYDGDVNVLQRRLKAVVDERFGGSERAASQAAGLNPNAVNMILWRSNHEPRVSTLAAMCRAFGWRLEDAVYWTLDQETPAVEEDPAVALEVALTRLGLAQPHVGALVAYVRSLAAPRPAKNAQ
jgi:hypothetical protein